MTFISRRNLSDSHSHLISWYRDSDRTRRWSLKVFCVVCSILKFISCSLARYSSKMKSFLKNRKQNCKIHFWILILKSKNQISKIKNLQNCKIAKIPEIDFLFSENFLRIEWSPFVPSITWTLGNNQKQEKFFSLFLNQSKLAFDFISHIQKPVILNIEICF